MTAREKREDTAIVIVHGIFGFHRLRYVWPGFEYFRGLKKALADMPVRIHFSDVPSGETVNRRAHALADFLSGVSAPHIHLIAHSMGGLDSRFLIHHLDSGRRIQSLSTVGTPHRGSQLAQWIMETRGSSQFVNRLLMFMSPGLEELSPNQCALFNATVVDRSDVVYRSYVGARPAREMPLWFRKQTKLIAADAGDNDSQVSVVSASWGDSVRVVRADHTELAGWSLGLPRRQYARPFDHVAFYRSVISDILS